MSSSVESLALLVLQLQQTVLAQGERLALLTSRVRDVEGELEKFQTAQRPGRPSRPLPSTSPRTPLDEHRANERERIIATLKETGWNRLEAARVLAMPRRTLYRRMVEYGIQEGDTRAGVAGREKGRSKQKGGA